MRSLYTIPASWSHCSETCVFHVSLAHTQLFGNAVSPGHLCPLCLYLFLSALKRFSTVTVSFVSVEVEDLKKINNSLTVLLSEKQRQEKVGSPDSSAVH